MKKFFFPKSSSSYEGECRQKSPAPRDKKHSPQARWKTVGSGDPQKKYQSPEKFVRVCERKGTEKRPISRTRSLVLRRSQSFQVSSSGAENSGRFNDQDLTELRNWKVSSSSLSLCDCPDCDSTLKNDDSRLETISLATIQLPNAEALRDRSYSCPSNSSSPRSSFDSTSVPAKVLDLYVDGENHQETKHGKFTKHHPRSSKESNFFLPSDGSLRDYTLKPENQHESPRKLAKDVVERLLRIEQFYDPKNHGEEFPNSAPVTSTLCDKHLDGESYNPKADVSAKTSSLDDIFDKHLDGQRSALLCEDIEDPTDRLLWTKLEEVKERARLLHAHLAGGKDLVEKEKNLVLEIYEQLQYRIAERTAFKETSSYLKGEMNKMRVKLEREKEDVKSQLEKEMERRSDEWEVKMRKFQLEESRLRDRIRELAEKNVCLQKEVSDLYTKEKEYTVRLSHMEAQLNDYTSKIDIAKAENNSLQKELSEVQDKLKLAEDVQFSVKRKYKEKERECTELIKIVARLRGTCDDQERTINGLRQRLSSENLTNELQIEQLRLTGVEQDLRRQLETSSAETNSLRSENIYLLERLRNIGVVGGSSGLKLEQELVTHVKSLETSGLSLVNECIRMCEYLLGIMERKTTPEGFLESHSHIQCGMKIQGFRKGLELLTRSLGKTSSVLKDKTELVNNESDLSEGANSVLMEDDLKCELKAERLLTSILKEKLYSKEKEVEHMQIELARALRYHDVLEREIQNAADTASCVNHKMKTLELQMIKKDATINDLQGDVRSYDEELAKTRGTLSKVTQERDLMWQEVKQYSEKNMLLNHEIASLRKKIEALEEDTLLKDGQISILKDSLNNAKSYSILFDS